MRSYVRRAKLSRERTKPCSNVQTLRLRERDTTQLELIMDSSRDTATNSAGLPDSRTPLHETVATHLEQAVVVPTDCPPTENRGELFGRHELGAARRENPRVSGTG